MTWLWWALLALSPLVGGVTWWSAETSGAALVQPGVLGGSVLLAWAAYPAWRLYRVATRTAPAAEWLRFTFDGGRLSTLADGDVPSLCLDGVPPDAQWAGRQLVAAVVDYLRTHGGFSVDTLRANLVSPKAQQLPHCVTLSSGNPRVLTDTQAGSSTALLAAHLNACSEPLLGQKLALPLLHQSLALFPGNVATVSPETVLPNENNCMAHKALGDTLVELGRTKEGLRSLEDAVARSPKWAEQFKAQVLADLSPGLQDPRVDFWRTLDVEETRRQVLARG